METTIEGKYVTNCPIFPKPNKVLVISCEVCRWHKKDGKVATGECEFTREKVAEEPITFTGVADATGMAAEIRERETKVVHGWNVTTKDDRIKDAIDNKRNEDDD